MVAIAMTARHVIDVDAIPLPAFGLESDSRGPLVTPWHAHAKHQLLYAAAGTLQLEVEGSQWLLPPQRAAWIRASVRHRVRALGRLVQLRTVYLAPETKHGPKANCVVFAASPLAREMILHAMRWGPNHRADETARAFFATLALLCAEWASEAMPFRLPTAKSRELGKAMQFAIDAMAGNPTVEQAAKHAGLSARTLARRFAEEAQTTWRKFLHDARMMRALELLAAPKARVTDVAFAIGFESPSAFTHAFEEFTSETPKDYRKRAIWFAKP